MYMQVITKFILGNMLLKETKRELNLLRILIRCKKLGQIALFIQSYLPSLFLADSEILYEIKIKRLTEKRRFVDDDLCHDLLLLEICFTYLRFLVQNQLLDRGLEWLL